MTGPEHYAAAESLLQQLRQAQTSMTVTVTAEKTAAVMAEAQVHATLALAAATALQRGEAASLPRADYNAWEDAAGTKVPTGGVYSA